MTLTQSAILCRFFFSKANIHLAEITDEKKEKRKKLKKARVINKNSKSQVPLIYLFFLWFFVVVLNHDVDIE